MLRLKSVRIPRPSRRGLLLAALAFAYLGVVGTVAGTVLWLFSSEDEIIAAQRAMRPTLLIRDIPVAEEQPSELVEVTPDALNMLDQSGNDAANAFSAALGDGANGANGANGSEPKPDAFAELLHPHPDPALLEENDVGMLPRISDDGRRPWRVYSRPYNELDTRPRVAVVLKDLGLDEEATKAAIRLPGVVTLAFAPYAQGIDDWIERAREAGHEVLITLPMEPIDYPRSDPGPYALLTTLAPDENLRRLEWVLSRTTGYVGVTNFQGSKFASDTRSLRPIMAELKRRGLLFLDSHASVVSVVPQLIRSTGIAGETADKSIDVEASESNIRRGLEDLVELARRNGSAIAVGQPYPVTLRTVRAWIETLDVAGVMIVPLSAVVEER